MNLDTGKQDRFHTVIHKPQHTAPTHTYTVTTRLASYLQSNSALSPIIQSRTCKILQVLQYCNSDTVSVGALFHEPRIN